MKRIISLALTAVLLLGVFLSTGLTVRADTDLKVSDECIDILKAYEGFCKYPYWDYGQWTVGYGTRCPADKLDTYKQNGITEEEAEELLRSFIVDYEEDLHYFVGKYSLSTTQNQFDAMFLFSYNCGSGWIYSTSGNFHKAMADPTTDPATVLYQFGTWSNAGDTPLVGLIKRRLAEANMYLNGVYSKNRPSNYCYVIYEPAGGDIEDCVHAYNVDLGATAPITPTLTGYIFEGWFTEKTGGTQVTALDASTDGRTLYARWKSDGTMPELPPESSEGYPVTKLEPPVVVKVTTDELNLRKGPGTNYTPLTYVVEGDSLTITATSQDELGRLWGYTDKGWACLEFTNYDQVVGGQTQPEPDEPETPSEPEPPVSAEGEVGTVIANGALNIRKGPGTSYQLVGEYPTKARICILEQQENGATVWGRTNKGWVSMTYVRLDSAGESQNDAANSDIQVQGAKSIRKGGSNGYGIPSHRYKRPTDSILDQVIAGAQNWGKTNQNLGGVDHANDPAEVPTPEQTPSLEMPQAGKTGTVSVESVLNIRSGAGTGYSTVGIYRDADQVTILEEAFIGAAHWGRTDKGWINMAFVVLDEASAEAGTLRTVTAACLNIRQDADENANVVGCLNAGDKTTVWEIRLVDDAFWGKTEQGWIALDYTK